MTETPYFIELEEAITLLDEVMINTSEEFVNLDNAHGRILAQGLAPLVDDPPFDNSAMDGFAVIYQDTINPPTELTIQGTIQAAGVEHSPKLLEGHAMRIMTGAPMPDGADAILPIERCEVKSDRVILLEEGRKNFIRKKGENLKLGEEALSKGSFLTPSRVGLCATMGYAKIPVQKKLTIAVISTGDELRAPGETLREGEIYESNAFGICGLIKMMGHTPVRFPAVEDSLDGLRDALNKATECDLIITSGGVSMGEFDLVRNIMEREGEIIFWRVKIRPGSPPLFGKWKETPMFGLPGNPVSSHVVFRMLVAPWLLKVTGADGPNSTKARAKLSDPVKATKDCLTLRRVIITPTDEGLLAEQPKHQGSGNLESLASADALTLLKPGDSGAIGEMIDILLL